MEDHNYVNVNLPQPIHSLTCKSPLANAKPFPEPNANPLTPAPDDNLAPGNKSVDGWVSNDCSSYSPSNSSEEDLESDDESSNTSEKGKKSLFLKASFLVFPNSVHNV